MGKILRLPQPIGPDGQVLTAEEIELMSQEPEYIACEIMLGSHTITCHVAVDYEQVDADADRAYQKFKSKILRTISEATKPQKNSKFTNLKEQESEEASAEDVALMESMMNLEPEQRVIAIDLLFPAKGKKVILGHNIPDAPPAPEMREWFENGTRNSRFVLEALVSAYDPTNPLTGLSQAMRRGVSEPSQSESSETETGTSSEAVTTPASDTKETSSTLSQGLSDSATAAGSGGLKSETASSTGSPSPCSINAQDDQRITTEALFPGGANPSNSQKSTTIQPE